MGMAAGFKDMKHAEVDPLLQGAEFVGGRKPLARCREDALSTKRKLILKSNVIVAVELSS